jgi:hypothetical protein
VPQDLASTKETGKHSSTRMNDNNIVSQIAQGNIIGIKDFYGGLEESKSHFEEMKIQ